MEVLDLKIREAESEMEWMPLSKNDFLPRRTKIGRIQKIIDEFSALCAYGLYKLTEKLSGLKVPKEDCVPHFIGKTLVRAGVKRIYAVCGGHVTPILLGCEKKGIEVIGGRDERTMGYAAASEAIFTGVPGTLVVTAGPGLAYAFGAVKDAYVRKLPVVVISGSTATALEGRGALQDSDQLGDMKRCVKYYIRINRLKDIPQKLSELYGKAIEDVPGPVYAELPLDVSYPPEIVNDWYMKFLRSSGVFMKLVARLKILWLLGIPENIDENFEKVGVSRASNNPSRKAIVKAARCIGRATKPVLVLGGEIIWSPQKDKLDSIVRSLGIPAFTIDLARGILQKDNSRLFSRAMWYALRKADCIILAGAPPDFRLGYGQWMGGFNRKAKIVRLDLDPGYLAQNAFPVIAIKADPVNSLLNIARQLQKNSEDYRIPAAWEAWAEELKAEEEAKNKGKGGLLQREEVKYVETQVHPLRLARELEKVLAATERKKIIIMDGGNFMVTMAQEIRSYDICVDVGPFGSLGVGLGFAIAAKKSNPHADVWVLFGDGAFGYGIADLDTAEANRVGFVGIIGNNAAWEEIKSGDEKIYGKGKSVSTDLKFRRYENAAKIFNLWGTFVQNPARLEQAFQLALFQARNGIPAIINVLLGPTSARGGAVAV
jgi:thiamine pyrophosphate-dependent acetolactate synthase large subunit-like protein